MSAKWTVAATALVLTLLETDSNRPLVAKQVRRGRATVLELPPVPARPPVITGIQPNTNLASGQADRGRVRGREWTGRVESWAASAWPHTVSSARLGSGGGGMRSHCWWGQDRHWYFVQRTCPPSPRPFTWRGTGNSYVHTPCSPRLEPPDLRGHFNPANLLRSPRPCQAALAKGLRQQGHSPSMPRASARNAAGCGRVVIALKAKGARWA